MAEEEIVHPIETDESKPSDPTKKILAAVALVAILAGVGTGFLVYKTKPSQLVSQTTTSKTGEGQPTPPALDSKTFRDSAEGTVEKKDENDNNEGTHKLVREGGVSQTVYLVSSVVDLDKYVGKKVTVWGETFSSTQVGWLMDVGRVEEK